MAFNSNVPNVSSGNVYPAATYNSFVAGGLDGLQAAWDSWTPALTGTTNPTLGTGGSAVGTFSRMGKTIFGQGDVAFGTSGISVGTGGYAMSIPVACTATAVTLASKVGEGLFSDASGRSYHFDMIALSTTTCRLVEAFNGTFLSASSPVVPAINDHYTFTFFYQAA